MGIKRRINQSNQIHQVYMQLRRCRFAKEVVAMILGFACLLGKLGYTQLVPVVLAEGIIIATAIIILSVSGIAPSDILTKIIHDTWLITCLGIPTMIITGIEPNTVVSIVVLWVTGIVKNSVTQAKTVCDQAAIMNK